MTKRQVEIMLACVEMCIDLYETSAGEIKADENVTLEDYRSAEEALRAMIK